MGLTKHVADALIAETSGRPGKRFSSAEAAIRFFFAYEARQYGKALELVPKDWDGDADQSVHEHARRAYATMLYVLRPRCPGDDAVIDTKSFRVLIDKYGPLERDEIHIASELGVSQLVLGKSITRALNILSRRLEARGLVRPRSPCVGKKQVPR